MKDLFGEEIVEREVIPECKTLIQKKLGKYNYRKSDSKVIRCKNCSNLHTFDYHNKVYHKCELLGISHSTATDIKVNNICEAFNDGVK